MNLVFLNYHFDTDLRTESDLIHRFRSSHQWCKAVLSAGAETISIVQRFHYDAECIVDNIHYYFVNDGLGNIITPLDKFPRIHDKILHLKPDVIHANGFPYPLITLRNVLPKTTTIIWQHHGGGFPQWYSQPLYKSGFQAVDSFLFSTIKLADLWKQHSLISPLQDVYEVMESSSTFSLCEKNTCCTKLGLKGKKIFLWVGRLDSNKDPITVIKGFQNAINDLKDPHLYMIYHDGNLVQQVQKIITELNLQDRVHLIGSVQHDLMEEYYNAADYFVLGSHHEGSGFALLESLACGVTPIVTNIPSFKKIINNGEIGQLCACDDEESFANAIRSAIINKKSKEDIRLYFENNLSYESLGKQTLSAYQHTYTKRNSPKKRVAIFVPGGIGSPQSGLHIPVLTSLVSKLSESFDITVYSLIRLSDQEIDYACGNAKIIHLNLKLGDSFLKKVVLLLRTFLKNVDEFDLIHGLWATPTGLAAVIASKLFGIPSVISLLGGETANLPQINYGQMRTPLLRTITKWTIQNATTTIVLSSFQLEQLRQNNIPLNNVQVIPLGVETTLFETTPKELPQEPYHFLHVGSFVPVKDHETLLRTFKIVSDNVQSELKLVGMGYLEPKVKILIQELNLENLVTIVGYVDYSEIKQYYQWADVLLHTSLHEAQAMVVLEAAVSNVVICGTKIGPIMDFSPNKAISVEVQDYKSLATRVLQLLKDPERFKMLQHNAHDWAMHHNIDWTVEQIGELYHQL